MEERTWPLYTLLRNIERELMMIQSLPHSVTKTLSWLSQHKISFSHSRWKQSWLFQQMQKKLDVSSIEIPVGHVKADPAVGRRGAAFTPRDGNAPYITVLAVLCDWPAVCIYNAPTGRPFIADLYYGRKFTCVVVNFVFTPSGLHDLKHLVRHRIMRQCDMGHFVVRGTDKGMVQVNSCTSLTIQPYGTLMNQTFNNLYTNNNGCKEDDCCCQLLYLTMCVIDIMCSSEVF